MEREKYIDESWKESATNEKESLQDIKGISPKTDSGQGLSGQPDDASFELNFVNYITSLTFQALIFLGEIPNPMAENKIEINLPQVKFFIDTLILIREKTKGNLSQEEENLLNSSIYELQVKYVEQSRKEGSKNDR